MARKQNLSSPNFFDRYLFPWYLTNHCLSKKYRGSLSDIMQYAIMPKGLNAISREKELKHCNRQIEPIKKENLAWQDQ